MVCVAWWGKGLLGSQEAGSARCLVSMISVILICAGWGCFLAPRWVTVPFEEGGPCMCARCQWYGVTAPLEEGGSVYVSQLACDVLCGLRDDPVWNRGVSDFYL